MKNSEKLRKTSCERRNFAHVPAKNEREKSFSSWKLYQVEKKKRHENNKQEEKNPNFSRCSKYRENSSKHFELVFIDFCCCTSSGSYHVRRTLMEVTTHLTSVYKSLDYDIKIWKNWKRFRININVNIITNKTNVSALRERGDNKTERFLLQSEWWFK